MFVAFCFLASQSALNRLKLVGWSKIVLVGETNHRFNLLFCSHGTARVQSIPVRRQASIGHAQSLPPRGRAYVDLLEAMAPYKYCLSIAHCNTHALAKPSRNPYFYLNFTLILFCWYLFDRNTKQVAGIQKSLPEPDRNT